MHQHINFCEVHPPLKRQPLKYVEVPISSIFEKGDPQLDHVFEVWQVEDTNEQTINYDASSLQLVFDLICEMKHPETYAPLSHENDLKPLASRAIELIDKSIDRITPFAPNDLQYFSLMSSVQIYKDQDDSLCPVLRTMLQIALSLKMAKTICDYDNNKMDCNQYCAIRNLFRRLFLHSTESKSMLFKPGVFVRRAIPLGVPFDGFIWHEHPAIMGAGVFILMRHNIAIRPVHLCTLALKKLEKVMMPDTLQPAFIFVGNDWRVTVNRETYYDERITTQGFRVAIQCHLIIVLGLFLSGVIFVVLINTLNRTWVNSVGVDPTSMLSLIIVIVGVLTTAIKAAFVENWNWFDFIRGRYYKTRIGQSEVVNLARTAIKSPVNQRHLFNKSGFSYVPGSSKEGPIVTDVPVNSAQLARHGAVVVWNSEIDPIFFDNQCIVYSTGNNRMFSLSWIDNDSYEMNNQLATVGVILSNRQNILLR